MQSTTEFGTGGQRASAAPPTPYEEATDGFWSTEDRDERWRGGRDEYWSSAPAKSRAEDDGYWSAGTSVPAGGEAATQDQRLLTALRTLIATALPVLYPRVLFIAFGFSAITALALAYSEMLTLPVAALFILVPSVIGTIVLGLRHREWGWRALVGYSAGLMATAVYDGVRLGLVEVGFWDDPIPHIGTLLLGDQDPHFWWGYFWRFYGNGALMGMAYAMLPWRSIRTGVLYGTAVCLGLFAVLALFPVAQGHLFPLIPPVAAGAMLGHWVYGGVLGWAVAKRIPTAPVAAATEHHPGPAAGAYPEDPAAVGEYRRRRRR